MLRAIRQNSLSLFISAVSLSGYAAWVALPYELSVQQIYDHYRATVVEEDSRGRVFQEGVSIRLNREAPPVAALEEALRDQPWGNFEQTAGLQVAAIELKPVLMASMKIAESIIQENKRFWSENEVEKVVAAAPVRVFSEKQTGVSREKILAALFGPMTSASAPAPAPQRKPVDRSGIETSASLMSTSVVPQGRQILIRGPIEFSGGLALTDSRDRLVVLREARGQFIESGAVWIREARYEIFVETLEGALVAEVRSPQGDVIGRGHIDLSRIVQAGNRIDGVALTVSPVASGLNGTTYSAYSSAASPKGIAGAKVEVKQTQVAVKTVAGGHFEEPRLVDGSRVVARVTARDYWPTIATVVAGAETKIPLYSSKMMKAFLGLTSNQSVGQPVGQTTGVIWGRVTRSGQPAAGAKVEPLTEGVGNPVYFNDFMLPDPKLTQTGANGLFAIHVIDASNAITESKSTAHFVQVRMGMKTSDPVLLTTEAGAVSSLELDIMQAAQTPARAFDAFRSDWPLNVEIRPLGHPKSRTMVVPGEQGGVIRIAHLGQPTVLDLDAGPEYLRTRTIQNASSRYLQMPMVQRDWFDRIAGQLKHNGTVDSGNIMGFIQGNRFRVSIEKESISSETKVVYFDSRGEITSRDYGDAGGGFILFGVKDGLRTVLVESDGSDRAYAATVLVENGVVASFSQWLR